MWFLLAGKQILGFAARHWDKVVLVLLIAAIVLYIYARGRNDERNKLQPKLDAAVAELAKVKKDFADASERDALAREAIVEDKKRTVETLVRHYEERVHANNAVADNLRIELRRARESRLRPLAPVATAPATCGDYEADRTKLPARDQDFLVDLAQRCNDTANTLKACQQYAVEIHEGCTRKR